MDDPNRLMHSGQSLMHQAYGLPPGMNMSSLDQGNLDTENMSGHKQVFHLQFIFIQIIILNFLINLGHQ